jgi:hypothetical protein
MVAATEIPKLTQKCNPLVSRTGKSRKNANEGNTRKKIDRERSAIAFVSVLSIYIQIRASRDVRGNEAISAPKNELRLAISLTATIMDAERANLTR